MNRQNNVGDGKDAVWKIKVVFRDKSKFVAGLVWKCEILSFRNQTDNL